MFVFGKERHLSQNRAISERSSAVKDENEGQVVRSSMRLRDISGHSHGVCACEDIRQRSLHT